MKIQWWKILAMVLLVYVVIYGFYVPLPVLDGRMQETIRNLFFHVPMWFAMMILFTCSVYNAIRFLKSAEKKYSYYSVSFAAVGLWFGLLGIITGAVWAKSQWGNAWSGDPKQNGAAIAILIYIAYFILRKSAESNDKIHRVAAIYNIFAYCMLFPTIWILPRLTESLHPGGQGTEGNPGLNPKDLDNSLRLVFYPAILGFTLLGIWIANLHQKWLYFKSENFH